MQHGFWIRNGVEHDPRATLELAVAAEESGSCSPRCGRRRRRWHVPRRGVMPYWPGTAEGRDPDVAEGANERELRELLAHYRDQGDGIVVVPRLERFGAGYDALCEELDVDWQLTCDPLDVAAVRHGPPDGHSGSARR